MKKCKYWSQYGKPPLMYVNGGWCHDSMASNCPNNTNCKCEVIPRKRKAKVVTIKAWAHPDILITKNPLAWVSLRGESKTYSMPCTITCKVEGKK